MWKIPNYLKTILELMWVKQGQKKKKSTYKNQLYFYIYKFTKTEIKIKYHLKLFKNKIFICNVPKIYKTHAKNYKPLRKKKNRSK